MRGVVKMRQNISFYVRQLLLKGATYNEIQGEFKVDDKQISELIDSFSDDEKIEYQAVISKERDAINTDALSVASVSDRENSPESEFADRADRLNETDSQHGTEDAGRKPISAGQSNDMSDTDIDGQLKGAVDEVKRVENLLVSYERNRQETLFLFIARVYLISMASQRDSEFHQSLLDKGGVVPQSNTPHHKQVLRSILRLANVNLPKQTEHEGCLVLEGLEEAGVAEQEAAVMEFFTGSAGINEQARRGFARAKAARSSSKRLRSLRKARQDENNSNLEATKDNLITEARLRPLGKISAGDEDLAWTDDLHLLLCDGHDVLIQLNVPPEQLRAIVIKHGARR